MKYIKKNEPPRSLEAYCRTENANFDDMQKMLRKNSGRAWLMSRGAFVAIVA